MNIHETTDATKDNKRVCARRQSIAFFVVPDHYSVVCPYMEPAKYNPVVALEYMQQSITTIFPEILPQK